MREGHVLAGRYRILRQAAAGSMGTVYQALDSGTDALVAIKTIRVDREREPARSRSRLFREAEALAALRHPAVVRYLDHGETDDSQPFLVMAWVNGETLQHRLDAQGLEPMEALQLAALLASGLTAVHACGVIHRDLKPSNVMLGGGRVAEAMLVDFGVARLTRSTTELTATGEHVGTPSYMAPEQIRNPRAVDARADVFALGCILFECLTGRMCFAGDDAVQVLARILFAPAPVPSAIRPDLPRAFDEIVLSFLQRDPSARPTSSLAEHILGQAVEGLTASARHLSSPLRHAAGAADEAASPTLWEGDEDMAPPPSFQLGANAVVEATRRALPAYRGTFIGRETVSQELLSTLRSGAPAVVVWGGPGIGKTRLVVEALRQIASQGDPPWDALVYGDLRDARTADDVVRLLAREAGISLESSASPEIALGRALGKLGRVLLVLDPIEHLPDLLAATMHAFARMSRTTQVLAMSRRRWSAAEATSIELGPLPTRSEGGSVSPAALLLLERGGWSLASLTHADVGRAEQVASALEGIPLAIELSATHAQLLGIEGLLARVGGPRGPAALTLSVSREDEPMHRALERSWELLRPAEREAFVQCAVFRGGFTADAAEAVVRVGPPAPSTLALLQSLRDSSLLFVCSTHPSWEGRLSMFAPMKEFALARLQGAEQEAALQRHAQYYANLQDHLPDRGAAPMLARIELEADNLLAAAEFSLAHGSAASGMKALVILEQAIFSRGAIGHYIDLLDRAIARAESAVPGSQDALVGLDVRQTRARFDAPAGRSTRAQTDLALCLESARRSHDVRREGAVLLDLGVVHHLERALVAARGCYEAAMERLSDPADAGALGRCIGNIGAVYHDEGKLTEASPHYRQAIELLGQAGETRRRANFIGNLAVLEQELGRLDESRRLFDEALCLLEPLRDARLLAIILGNYGVLELEEGRAERALELSTRGLALLAGTGDTPSRALCLGRLAAALSLLGRTAEAEVRQRQAEHLAVRGDHVIREAIALMRGFLELALANEACARGRPTAASEHLSAARATVARVVGAGEDEHRLCDRSDDLRSMVRILSALIER